MSSKGKPLHPQKRLNPPMHRGRVRVGDFARWNGQAWVPANLAQTVQDLIDSGAVVMVGGEGLVTGIALTMPKEFVSPVAGSPALDAGTLAVALNNQTANQVWAGPTSGSAAEPSFRALVPADLAPPDAIEFDPVTDAGTNGLIESDPVEIDGDADQVWPFTVRGEGSPAISIDGGTTWLQSLNAIAGDEITVRLTSSGSSSTERVATVYYPGGSAEFSVTTGVGYDADTDAFLTAAGISDATIGDAVDDLVVALKAASLWTKLAAFYPFVGGSASTHKWNLKDPQDTDGAYRLSFTGSWTHNSNGITGDGSTSYADTHFVPSTGFTSASSGAFGVYSRTNSSSGTNPYDMGTSDGSDAKATIVISKYSSGNTYFGYGTGAYPSTSGLSSAGMFTTNRNSGTNTTGYRNDTQVLNSADTVTLHTSTIYIGASNKNGTATYFSPKNWAAAFIFTSGLNGTEITDLYNAVQAFQTALSRNV